MKKIITSICTLALAAVLLGSSTFAWFSMNRKVEVSGFNVKAKSSSSLVIVDASLGKLPTNKTSSTSIDFNMTDAVVLYQSTHDASVDSHLKQVTNLEDVDALTGNAHSLTVPLKYKEAVNVTDGETHYITKTIIISAIGGDLDGQDLQISLDNDVANSKLTGATSVDFYWSYVRVDDNNPDTAALSNPIYFADGDTPFEAVTTGTVALEDVYFKDVTNPLKAVQVKIFDGTETEMNEANDDIEEDEDKYDVYVGQTIDATLGLYELIDDNDFEITEGFEAVAKDTALASSETYYVKKQYEADGDTFYVVADLYATKADYDTAVEAAKDGTPEEIAAAKKDGYIGMAAPDKTFYTYERGNFLGTLNLAQRPANDTNATVITISDIDIPTANEQDESGFAIVIQMVVYVDGALQRTSGTAYVNSSDAINAKAQELGVLFVAKDHVAD